MPNVAILIAASPTPAFFSQVAALSLALSKLQWSRWQYSVHMCIGGPSGEDAQAQWRPHLRNVHITHSAESRFAQDGDWAQSDDVFRFAPPHAAVLLAMYADTLPVSRLEGVLDQVVDGGTIAGVIAHAPFPRPDGTTVSQAWATAAHGLIDVPLDFVWSHTLFERDEDRATPFYLNFGVVFFPRCTFDDVAARYLSLRPRVISRMRSADYSGQVALTLAITGARARTCALPMRYNFPNDPVAAELYPEELANVVIFHYLRTGGFDRHTIFTSAENYRDFLARPLTGVDRMFQQSVRALLGTTYPFG